MTIPIRAATSEWGFTMSANCYLVNGLKNDAFHTLSSGTVSISGTLKSLSSLGVEHGANTIYIDLYNSTTGNYFGTISVKPVDVVNGSVKFTRTFPKAVGGGTHYYLKAWRNDADGIIVEGKGDLYNN